MAPNHSRGGDKVKRSADNSNAAFWREALRLYAKTGATDDLLRWQDHHGGDVMAALWALAAAGAGRRLAASDLNEFAEATARFRAEAALLRAARRAAKAEGPDAYEAAKARELAAERAVAAAAPVPAAAGAPGGSPKACAAANLALLAATLEPRPPSDLMARIAALVD